MRDRDATLTNDVDAFFETYERALLTRDAEAIAALYSIPSLIVFPGNLIPVTSTEQTREFFDSAFDQYEGVDQVEREALVIAEAPGSVWADVTWLFTDRPAERFCYQLAEGEDGYQIVVLTPLQ